MLLCELLETTSGGSTNGADMLPMVAFPWIPHHRLLTRLPTLLERWRGDSWSRKLEMVGFAVCFPVHPALSECMG